jgi:cardiolipin synthase
MAGCQQEASITCTRPTLIASLRSLPNLLTLVRLLLVPAMWIFALLGMRSAIGFGMAVALATDFLDGPLARRLGQTSEFGARFDSLADQLLQLSAIVWILMLMPEIFADNLLASTLAIVIYAGSLTVGILKFRRIANLHLHMSKASGLLLYVFLIHAFTSGHYSPVLFFLACTGFIVSSAETLLLQLVSSDVDEHIGSVLFLYLPPDHFLRKLARRLP